MSASERIEILELLQTGKITAQEAADLLNNVTKAADQEDPPQAAAAKPQELNADHSVHAAVGVAPTALHVRVSNKETGRNKVTVNIPLGMLKFGLKLGSRFTPELEGLDLNELGGMMADLKKGMLVEVEDEESNEHVQVFID